MNPYEVLGVATDAGDADIKKAYHKLVMKYHPDKNQGDAKSTEKFKEINNAFDTLRDPQKRAAYDRFGDAAFAGGNGASAGNGNPFGGGGNPFGGGMEDIIREAMRGFGGFGDMHDGASGANRNGRDLLDEITIDLSDAFFGKTSSIKFSSNVSCEKCSGFGTDDGKPAPICEKCRGRGTTHQQRGFFTIEVPCQTCNGIGRKIRKKCNLCDGTGALHKQRVLDVKIPAGIEDGARLRLNGQGEAGKFGADSGDFYIDIKIRPDKRFIRRGSDLILSADISFPTLAMGGEIEITTIDNKKLTVKIPGGTQVGEKLRVRGHGMPGLRGGFGDLYVDVGVHIPTKLNEKQKKTLIDFAEIKSDKKGWF